MTLGKSLKKIVTVIFLIGSLSNAIGAEKGDLCSGNVLIPEGFEAFAVECFEKRTKDSTFSDSSQALLSQDKEVCDCMKGHITIKEMFNQSEVVKKKIEVMSKVAILERRFEVRRNAMIFDATLMAPNEKNAADFAKSYSLNSEFTQVLNPSNSLYKETRENFVNNSADYLKQGQDHRNFISKFGGAVGSRAKWVLRRKPDPDPVKEESNKIFDKLQPENKSTSELFQDALAPGQCVSARAYLSFKKLPTDNDFYKYLSRNETFVEADWNIRNISNEIKTLDTPQITQIDKVKLSSLLARQQFLRRNPLIKNLFAASKDGVDKKDLEGNRRLQNIDARKDQLFKILRSLAPSDKSCLNTEGKCVSGITAQTNGKIKALKEFQDKSRAFFANRDVRILVNLENKKSITEELNEFKKDLDHFNLNLPLNPNTIEKVARAINADIVPISQCNGVNFNVKQCAESFALYCPLLDTSLTSAKSLTSEERIFKKKDWTIDVLNEMDTNIETNNGLHTFNEEVCNSKRKTSLGEQATFSEFKEKTCSNTVSRPPSCANNDALVDEYFTRYSELDEEHHQHAVGERFSIPAFANFMRVVPPPTFTAQLSGQIDRQHSSAELDAAAEALYQAFGGNSDSSAGRSVASIADGSMTDSQPADPTAAPATVNNFNPMNQGQNVIPPYINPINDSGDQGAEAKSLASPAQATALANAENQSSTLKSDIGQLDKELANTTASSPQFQDLLNQKALDEEILKQNQIEIANLKADIKKLKESIAQPVDVPNRPVGQFAAQSSQDNFFGTPTPVSSHTSIIQNVIAPTLDAGTRGAQASVPSTSMDLNREAMGRLNDAIVKMHASRTPAGALTVSESEPWTVDEGQYLKIEKADGGLIDIVDNQNRIPVGRMVKIKIKFGDKVMERMVQKTGDKVYIVSEKTIVQLRKQIYKADEMRSIIESTRD